ncbi:hypothetical protein [Paraburkholderia sediminicola]|uniref:hypothetical protein n=1 Tax=Paraburkholderia sediminicola TaxID=458836 RepID=UPI0038B7E073
MRIVINTAAKVGVAPYDPVGVSDVLHGLAGLLHILHAMDTGRLDEYADRIAYSRPVLGIFDYSLIGVRCVEGDWALSSFLMEGVVPRDAFSMSKLELGSIETEIERWFDFIKEKLFRLMKSTVQECALAASKNVYARPVLQDLVSKIVSEPGEGVVTSPLVPIIANGAVTQLYDGMRAVHTTSANVRA